MFSWLFLYGMGGIGNIRGEKSISDIRHKQHLLMYHDKRFQKDSYFSLIAFNHEQIKNATTGGFLLANRDQFDTVAHRLLNVNELTLSSLITKLQQGHVKASELDEDEKECLKLIHDIDYIGAHVPGSITSKKRMRNEIWSLTSSLGAPNWFITYAPADIHHPIAIYFADTKQTIYPPIVPASKRIELIASNPVAGARFFKFITDTFIQNVLGV